MTEEIVCLSLSFDYPELSVAALAGLLDRTFTAAGFQATSGPHGSGEGVTVFRRRRLRRSQRCTVMLESAAIGARVHLAGIVPLALVNTLRAGGQQPASAQSCLA